MLVLQSMVLSLTYRYAQHFGKAFNVPGRNLTTPMAAHISDLSKINHEPEHPMILFNEWFENSKTRVQGPHNVCCLSTVSKDYTVSSRHVLMHEHDNDGFIFVTDKRSKKINQIENCPKVAMCFVWHFSNEYNEEIAQQVRIEGIAKALERKEFNHIFENQPAFAKIRSHVCAQGRSVEWSDLKQRHDQVLDKFEKENNLPMPDHFVGYKLLPNIIEFYYAKVNTIADRLNYKKDASSDKWQCSRLAA